VLYMCISRDCINKLEEIIQFKEWKMVSTENTDKRKVIE
jgi:hypothetical protein